MPVLTNLCYALLLLLLLLLLLVMLQLVLLLLCLGRYKAVAGNQCQKLHSLACT
jgi:hypothetical protein